MHFNKKKKANLSPHQQQSQSHSRLLSTSTVIKLKIYSYFLMISTVKCRQNFLQHKKTFPAQKTQNSPRLSDLNV